MTGQQPAETLLEVLRPPLADSGLDVEAVELSTAGRRRVVRVLVDKDGGVTLDDLAAATTVVGDSLDNSDVLGDRPYTLEVTSPGTDRPLTQRRHWRRNVTRLVSVTRTDGAVVEGRIIRAGDQAATVDVHGEPTEVEYSDVVTARIQLEFNRPRSEEG
ncbi:MAG: ribosome maturation factor RimP [Nocardioidaceae bacterium]